MIVFLTLCYCALLVGLVKFRVVPFNTFWKLSPVLWMAGLFVVLFIPMQWGAPSGPIRLYQNVVEIVPNVTGEVTEVPVEPLVPIPEGAELFKIDPTPFQAAVDQSRAALAEARQAVPQLGASLDAARAAVAEAEALRDRSKDEYERLQTANENARSAGNRSLAFSESDVEQRRLTYVASEASLSRALATEEQARLAYNSNIDGVNTTVARLEAELRRAEFNLEETIVRAPSDGFVVSLTLQPGQRVANLPLRSWMAFVPFEQRRLVVAVPQSRLRFVRQGQDAEVTFAHFPGQVFEAVVEEVIPINAAAQVPPNGVLPSLAQLSGPNELMGVVLQLTDGADLYSEIPAGAGGTAAIYTNSVQPTHIIRKVMIRMDAWLNYIIPN
ncbi:MAG: efflux RND transporter periplasmic adaptor subunit [Pseudomonadota bacterium]